MSVQDECTFRFSSFLISLRNSLANSWFEIISLLTAPHANLFRVVTICNRGQVEEVLAPELFYQKIYRPLKQFHVDIHHILDF